jgi:hypothetical protein
LRYLRFGNSSIVLLLHLTLALLAVSTQLHTEIDRIKVVGAGIGQDNLVERVIEDVGHRLATKTYKVVVKLRADVIASAPTGVARLSNDPFCDELLENPEHRGARQARELGVDPCVELFRGRVVAGLDECFEQHPTLGCQT